MNPQLMPLGLSTVLFRHRRAVLTVFLGVIFAGAAYLVMATPRYQSVAQLVVLFGDRSVPDVARQPVTELTPSDRHEIVLAHAAMLDSHDLAEKTIESIGIDKLFPDVVADPPKQWSVMDEAVRQFLDKLAVDVGSQDNIITVSYMHPDKKLAHDAVRKLIELYISEQTAVYQNPQSDFMSSEVKNADARLQRAQAALEQFKGKWHITDYDQEVQNLLQQRSDVDNSLQTARANLEQAQHKQKDLEEQIKHVPAMQPEAAGGEKYRSLDDAESKLADLKAKRSQLLATYSPTSPALASLNAEIQTADEDAEARRSEVSSRSAAGVNTVHQTLQTDYLRTSADAESNGEPVRILSDQLHGIDQRLQDLQANRGTFNDLTREQQIAEDTYRSLSTQFTDARIKDNLTGSASRRRRSSASRPCLTAPPDRAR
jgi:uncharacterized protein involved in exopolysaccharide biosynthesis